MPLQPGDEIKRISKKYVEAPFLLTQEEASALALYQVAALTEWADGVDKAANGGGGTPPPPPKWPPA